MPRINEYKCTECALVLPSGWGGVMYVTGEHGERIACRHPGEEADVARALGLKEDEVRAASALEQGGWNWGTRARRRREIAALIASRTGFLSECLCRACLHQFRLDVDRDPKLCPACSGSVVATLKELVGEPCPSCGTGTVVEAFTGIRT